MKIVHRSRNFLRGPRFLDHLFSRTKQINDDLYFQIQYSRQTFREPYVLRFQRHSIARQVTRGGTDHLLQYPSR